MGTWLLSPRGRISAVTVMWLLLPAVSAWRITGGPWWPVGAVCGLVAAIATAYGVTDYRRDRREFAATQTRLEAARTLPPDPKLCAFCGMPHP